MPFVAKDITGQRFGRLTAIRRAGTRGGSALWLLRCDCGNEIETRQNSLSSGNTRSCGCMKDEYSRERLQRVTKYKRMLGALEYADAQIGLDPEFENLPVNIKAAYQRIHSTLAAVKEA